MFYTSHLSTCASQLQCALTHLGTQKNYLFFRQAERKWRLTKLQVHRKIYTGLCESYKQQMQSPKAKFYTTQIYECTRDNKAFFRIMDGLMKRMMKRKAAPKLPSPAAGTAQLAEDFLEFFTCKAFDIRSQLASRRLQTFYTVDRSCEQACTVSAF